MSYLHSVAKGRYFRKRIPLCGLFYRIEIGVRTVWVEDFVAVHHRHEVFSIREIDDVMGVTREHYHAVSVRDP